MEQSIKYRFSVGLLLTILLVVSTALAIHLHLKSKNKQLLEEEVRISNSQLTKSSHWASERKWRERRRDKSKDRQSGHGRVHISEEVDINEIYTGWSRWSRCSRKCKQKRERRCAVPSVCGSAVVRMERGCHSERCRGRDFHIVRKKKKLGRKTRTQMKRNRAFYSKWTHWSQCSDLCLTTRMKTCRFPTICGKVEVTEEAYCYTSGSQCEKWYKEGKSLDISDETLLKLGQKSPDATAVMPKVERSKTLSEYKGQCGRRHVNRPLLPHKNQHATDIAYALRIIGGTEAKPGRWPWQVVLLNKYREAFCGGTLVHPRWVLTAAHCVRKHLVVRVGEHDLVVHEGSEREYTVKRSILHPDYNRDTVDNDVALLELPELVTLGDNAALACLPEQDEVLPTQEHCTIIGWGKERKSHYFGTEVLHEARVPIVSMKDCMNVYRDYFITDNMFCAGYKGGRIDSCAGDSGGPLLCQTGHSWKIFGITSFGEGCGKQGKYGIYAKVPNYSSWIEKMIDLEETKYS